MLKSRKYGESNNPKNCWRSFANTYLAHNVTVVDQTLAKSKEESGPCSYDSREVRGICMESNVLVATMYNLLLEVDERESVGGVHKR